MMHDILLSGIVGSTAYGLATEGSDVDRLGIFAAPTVEFHGLGRPDETHVTRDPDCTLHEAAKWCRLALRCNPSVMELVWLPTPLYEKRTILGDRLIQIRSAFLCAERVREAYLGYAQQQFKKLERRGDGSFSSDTRKRTAKLMVLMYACAPQRSQRSWAVRVVAAAVAAVMVPTRLAIR